MFRIGKHRKDGITPSDNCSSDYATVGPKQLSKPLNQPLTKPSPPSYQPPPQPPKPPKHNGLLNGEQYRQQQQYANYEDLQSQLRYVL